MECTGGRERVTTERIHGITTPMQAKPCKARAEPTNSTMDMESMASCPSPSRFHLLCMQVSAVLCLWTCEGGIEAKCSTATPAEICTQRGRCPRCGCTRGEM